MQPRNILTLFLILASGIINANTIVISNTQLAIEISTFGAELQSIKDRNGTEYLWQGDSAFWGGRDPNMFPVNVRFKDEKFIYKGKEYEMPRMGLAKISTRRK